MAKTRAKDPTAKPSVVATLDPVTENPQPAATAEQSVMTTAAAEPEFISVTIRIPVAKPFGAITSERGGAINSHGDFTVRDYVQLAGMRAMHAGFYESHATLKSNGKHVDTLANSFRKLLEMIGEQVLEMGVLEAAT